MGGIKLKVLGVCAILAAPVCAQNTCACAADELVKFDSAPYIVGQIQQRRAIERGEMAVATTGAIEGYLSKPDGDGPFPAVIYLHGCSGLSLAARKRSPQAFESNAMTDQPMPIFEAHYVHRAFKCGHRFRSREAARDRDREPGLSVDTYHRDDLGAYPRERTECRRRKPRSSKRRLAAGRWRRAPRKNARCAWFGKCGRGGRAHRFRIWHEDNRVEPEHDG